MKRTLDEIINKCVSQVLIEAKIDAKKDPVVHNAQQRIVGRMKDLVKQRDEKTLSVLKNKGYNDGINNKALQKQIDKNFQNSDIRDAMSKDVLRIIKILQRYTIDDKGGINFNRLKTDYPSEYEDIVRMKNFIDLKGLTYLYDRSANMPSKSYGINWKSGEDENSLDFNNITDAEAKDYRGDKLQSLEDTKRAMKIKLAEQYLSFKYGLHMDIPNITLSNGNSKLPENTLIINFTSALNCPAWNECLVKHACYARSGEKRNPSTFRGNENRSLYWLTTEHDEKLMALMMDFVRSYCFNYTKIAQHLIDNKMAKGSVKNLAVKLSQMSLDNDFFTPEIIEVMKTNKRIDNIRLNENGDFIGQWLVDAWDNEAAKYQPYDINISAYTCRHLNYEGIKHIILNTSFQNGKGNVARRFIALPGDVYDSLDETYGGKNNELVYTSDNIQPNPQPLFDVTINNGNYVLSSTPNGKMFYKCPCGREANGTKINCYQCNLCYLPNNDNMNLFVFVKAHGSGSEYLNGYDLIKNKIGVSRNFLSAFKHEPVLQESNANSISKLKIASNDGIKGVTTNAINSTYDHFRHLDNQLQEKHVIRINQSDLIQIIKETIQNKI